MIDLVPLGDRAFLVRFEQEDSAASWAEAVRGRQEPGIVEVVTAYNTVGVFADPDRADVDTLESALRNVVVTEGRHTLGRLVTIPVLYDGADLADVARRLGITEGDVVAAHSETDYRVFAIGFLPGFPYAGYLPAVLTGLPRRDAPRTRVPAGSVAVVGRQTGIYPEESPGGWHLIGRTPLSIVDISAGRFPIRAGDRVRFAPIGAAEYEKRIGEPLG